MKDSFTQEVFIYSNKNKIEFSAKLSIEIHRFNDREFISSRF